MAITKAKIQSLLKKNLPKLGDAYINASYQHFATNPGYNANTSAITDDPTSTTSIKVIVAGFSFTKNQSSTRETADSSVLSIDRKIMFESSQINFTPRIGDKIVIGSTTYQVIGVNNDPYEAFFSLHARPLNEA